MLHIFIIANKGILSVLGFFWGGGGLNKGLNLIQTSSVQDFRRFGGRYGI